LIIGAVVLTTLADHGVAQDLAAGEVAFRKCQPCHDIGETAKNKLGPELNGLDGRKAGTAEGYSYSDSNKNSALCGVKRASKNTSKILQPRCPEQR
jgi:cytochrome c